jgi:hypothetical protein
MAIQLPHLTPVALQGTLEALWADSEPIPPVRDQRVSVADRPRLRGLNRRVLELLEDGPKTNVELAEALGHASSWRTRVSDVRLWLERNGAWTIVAEKLERGVWVYTLRGRA